MGPMLVLVRNPTAARPLLLLLLLPRHATVAGPVLQLLLLLLLRHATTAIPVLLWLLLLLLPRHATAARYHIVVAAAAAEACHRREIPYCYPFVGLRLPRSPRPDNHDRRQEHGGAMDVPGTGGE